MNKQTHNAFDAPLAIFAAIVVGFAGNAVFMGMPMLVGAMAEDLGFQEQQLGWLASADLGGIFIGSILTSLVIPKVNRRWFAICGIAIVVSCNYASTLTGEFTPLMAIRILAGFGSGICYSTGVACLAVSHHTGRNFSFLMFALVMTNALEFYTFPSITEHWGVNGLFICFAGVSAMCLLVIQWIPPYANNAPEQSQTHDLPNDSLDNPDSPDTASPLIHNIPKYIPWCCLLAVFCFNLLTGSFWPFIERAGVDAGFSYEFIGSALTWGTLFSFTGCLTAVWLSGRFGQSKPLLFALTCMTLMMLGVGYSINAGILNTFGYAGTIFSFCMFWIFTDVFQLGTISNIDHTGRYAALVPSSQGLSQTIAPVGAGYLLSWDMGYSSVMFMGACGSGLACLLYIFVYRKMKQFAPEIADES